MKKIFLFIFIFFIAVNSFSQGIIQGSGFIWQKNYIPAYTAYPNDSSVLFLNRTTGRFGRTHITASGLGGWGITGNSGISTQSNFFGTTNNAGITIKTYSIIAARFDSLQRVQVERLTALNDTASDFEIIIIPDIQNMTTNWPGTVNFANGQAAGRAIFEWIRNNITSKNIKVVITLGDLTNNGISPELDTADAWFDLLDPSNVVYILTIGNHDYNNNAPLTRNASNYLSFFGPSRIGAKSWYGGNYGPAPESYFTKFDLMGRKFGVISLEFFPRQAVLNWADSVLTANEDRTFFYVTHGYIDCFGERSTDTSLGSQNGVYGTVTDARGDSQWHKLIKKHRNIAFTFNGHFIHVANGDKSWTRRFTDVGDNGNVINQFFVNYQMDTAGGNGWISRFQFKPKENKIDVKYYSPYLDRYDQRVESFAYQFPNIAVQSSLAVQGTLSVKNETRFDGAVTFEKLRKFNIPYIGENGRLIDTSLFRMDNDSVKVVSDYFQTSKNLADNDSTGNVPSTKFVKKNFIQNQIAFPQQAGIYAWNPGSRFIFSTHPSAGYKETLQAGFPASWYFTMQGGGYGLSIQRSVAGAGAAHLNFFKNRNNDFSTWVSPNVGDLSGQISWFNLGSDNVTVGPSTRISDYIEGVTTTYAYGGLYFATSGPIVGQANNSMYLSGDGVLKLGTGITTGNTNAYLEMGLTRGFLPPRMNTATMNAIANPGTGLVVWNTDSLSFCSYNGTAWGFDGGKNFWTKSGNDVYNNNSGNVGINKSTPVEKLHVAGNGKFSGSNFPLIVQDTTGSGVALHSYGSGILFNGHRSVGGETVTGAIYAYANDTSQAGFKSYIAFNTNNWAVDQATERMRITHDGHLLLNTATNSTYILDVSGNARVQGDGLTTTGLNLDRTITAAGTTGNQTINKMSGTVNIAAAGTTVTVTNSLVTTNSIIFCVIRTNDATATLKNVVPASGSFVINLTAATTAEISIGFLVTN